jgi:two-component system, NtrC family, sensor kinase
MLHILLLLIFNINPVFPKNKGTCVEIRVKDNGSGFPEELKDKIFQQHFFTTKPAGQGTGLGLSFAYDIMKAHGGELKLKPKKNIGTTFIIELPIN